ncbi:MAG TPA: hypothetical protein VM695_04875 [Phycisphaerae bacterium]|nr:hypothetical protein [Phycisphaerae bacterium]
MTEYQIDDTEAAALSAQVIPPGVQVPTTDQTEWHLAVNRGLERIARGLANVAGLEVYKDAAGELKFGVRAGRCSDGPDAYAYAGCENQSLTDDETNSIYLTLADLAAGDTVTVSVSGFPAPATTPHIPLATIVCAGGVYGLSDMIDFRSRASLGVLAGFGSADAATAKGLAGGVAQTFAALEAWLVDGDGAETNGAGLVGEPTLTDVGATCVKVYDLGTTTYANLEDSADLTGWTSDWQLTADAANVQVGDAWYVGAAAPFAELAIALGQAATYSGDAGWAEYWNGVAWVDLGGEVHDSTDPTTGYGLRTLQQSGAMAWPIPADWAACEVDGVTAYWMRWIVAYAVVTQEPIADAKRPELVTPKYGAVAAVAGTVTRLRVSDGAATVHTTQDVWFSLVNYTTGAGTEALTWPMDERVHVWTGLTLAVAAGDVLGILVHQEDGTNEIERAVVEMTIVPG